MRILIYLPFILATSVAESWAQTTGTITAPSPRFRPLPVEITYVAETFADAAPTNAGDTSTFRAEQHIGFSYPLSETQRIQFRQYFLYNMSDYNETNEWGLGDHAFQYNDSRLGTINDRPISFYARLYLPGSEYSRALGKYELRLWADVEQILPNRFSLTYFLNPRFYAYSENNDGQLAARVFPGILLNYNASSKFKPFIGAFTEHGWRHSGASVNFEMRPQDPAGLSVNHDSLYHTLGAAFEPGPDLSIALYTETEDNLRDGQRISFLSEDTTIYYLDLRVGLF